MVGDNGLCWNWYFLGEKKNQATPTKPDLGTSYGSPPPPGFQSRESVSFAPPRISMFPETSHLVFCEVVRLITQTSSGSLNKMTEGN